MAVGALQAGITNAAGNATPAAEPRVLGPATLEVAVLDADRPRRAVRRSTGPALEEMLPAVPEAAAGDNPEDNK